eukprot:9562808-Ditylum_brightwellii.AAC.1
MDTTSKLPALLHLIQGAMKSKAIEIQTACNLVLALHMSASLILPDVSTTMTVLEFQQFGSFVNCFFTSWYCLIKLTLDFTFLRLIGAA